jgi:dihydrofolate reductase
MPEHRRYGTVLYETAGAFLFGRRTFEIWDQYWPTVTDPEDGIAAALNQKPRYVVPASPTAPSTVLGRDYGAAVAALNE